MLLKAALEEVNEPEQNEGQYPHLPFVGSFLQLLFSSEDPFSTGMGTIVVCSE